jgi:tetratricopeptide (TPR) repeat protein
LRKVIAIRRELAEDYPKNRSYRVSLTYNLSEIGDLLDVLGQPHEADDVRANLEETYRLILDVDPDNPRACNNLAWILASRVGALPRSATRAVELAERAVARVATEGLYWNTLGVARYRAGQWKAAAQALAESSRLRSGGDAYDWLFLAMARHQLGDHDQAKQLYDRSVEWIKSNAAANYELARFRAEAARLIGGV